MKRRFGEAIVVVLLAALPHVRTIRAGYTFDDHDFIENNASVRSLGAALSAFRSPFPPTELERGIYRPLTNLSYAIDRALFGQAAAAHHVSNVILYAVVCLLVLAFLRRHVPTGALAGAALFAVHPIHCEAVDSLAGRSELLGLGFGIAGLLALDRAASIAALAFAALAMLAKESGLMTLVLFAVYGATIAPPSERRRLLREIGPPALLLAIGYFALRLHVLGRFGPKNVLFTGASPVASRVLTMGAVFLENARLLVFPSTLDVDFYYRHSVGLLEAPSARATFGLLLAVAAVGGAARLAWLATKRGVHGRAAFGAIAFFVLYFPTSHAISSFSALMAERFLFGPSFGVALLVALGVAHVRDRHPAAAFAFVALAATGLAVRSTLRAAEWQDDVTLFSVTAPRTPDARAWSNLGTGYLRQGNREAAKAALVRALELNPKNPLALLDLGLVETDLEDLDAAEASFERLATLEPRWPGAENGLAIVAMKRWDYPRARTHLVHALELAPADRDAAANLASVDARLASARAFLAAAPEGPDDPGFLLAKARACLVLQDLACARASYEAARPRSGPDPVLEALFP
jgi:Flp pilus assembly protein TadD